MELLVNLHTIMTYSERYESRLLITLKERLLLTLKSTALTYSIKKWLLLTLKDTAINYSKRLALTYSKRQGFNLL